MKIYSILIMLFITVLSNAQTPGEALKEITGTFTGEWSSYMIVKGKVQPSVSWKDTVTCSNPVIEKDQAYVNVSNKMYFDNPHIPPYQFSFKEGFEQGEDKLLKHFIEVQGIRSFEEKISENTYVISQTISPYELKQLGFSEAEEAYHTTVKLILIEDGKETHRISRISTISTLEEGVMKTYQFLSLKGYHQRME